MQYSWRSNPLNLGSSLPLAFYLRLDLLPGLVQPGLVPGDDGDVSAHLDGGRGHALPDAARPARDQHMLAGEGPANPRPIVTSSVS